MQTAGMSAEEAEQIFSTMIHSSSGQIGLLPPPSEAHLSYTEFLAATLPKRFWLQRERVRDAFSRLDVDNDNYITPDDLKKTMGEDWTPQLYHQLFMEIGMTVGANHPGKVSVEELVDWFIGESGGDSNSVQSLSNSSSSNSLSNVHSSANLSDLESLEEKEKQQKQKQQQEDERKVVVEQNLDTSTSDTRGLLSSTPTLTMSDSPDLIGQIRSP
jgi:hypothetical protein